MFEFAIKLLLAHFIGDFLLQPKSWVEGRENNKLKSKHLYYHIAIHLLLLVPFLIYDFKLYWSGVLVIVISHFCIDLMKSYLKEKINVTILFIADQIAHLTILAVVVNAYHKVSTISHIVQSPKILLIALTLLLATKVSSIVIKVLVSIWAPKLSDVTSGARPNSEDESLQNAGTYIGMLERLLIILFIYKGFWEGIGYLLAAKSVFRIGDLTKLKDKKHTEYILIGTMISFSIAIGIGVAFKYSLENFIIP